MIKAIIIFVSLICITLSLIVIGLNEHKEEIWKTIEFKDKKGKKK